MNIEMALKHISTPKTYLRNGVECYYDPYREKLIQITPEETIRQKTARWLEEKLGVPNEVIIVEQHLSHYGVNSKDRADIIIHKHTEEGLSPLIIVECKADTVMLSDRACEQCFRYADLLAAEYAFIINGIEILAFKYDEQSDRYMHLSEIPTYTQMLNGVYKPTDSAPLVCRPEYNELMLPEIQKRYIDDYIIGSESSPEMVSYIINFFEALLDTSCSLASTESISFSIVKDLGVRILNYGNASGYDYVAPYRSFLIKERKTDNHQIVSIGFNAYGNNKTILCIAIDDYKKSHHALQLQVDKYTILQQNSLCFYHTGRISVGHKGSGSSKEILNRVADNLPALLIEGKIQLGCIPVDDQLYVYQQEMTELILNLMEYALLRDEYRNSLN